MSAFAYTQAQTDGVDYAVTVSETAPDNQVHETILEQIAPAAVATGLWSTQGDFLNEAGDKPIGVLLKWIQWSVALSTPGEPT
jgi:hypothetical protein